ncbi:hypothetical protein [Acinetobacter sp. ANC 5378]|uniref:hypothetical protein n=1 Tax=Acinetobacter sp. ANC 5378 TaxID=2731249 RepID=UPI00148F6DC2|nr:hypothetical protein [Acinetobacter sp. ANC 5378]NNG82919.1 hypothetical protein [Acinetobacter sp. ANC 5378]
MLNLDKFLSYHSPIQISHELPDDLAPVTPDAEGNVLSRFGDSIWDFRHLKSRHSTYDHLDFTEEGLDLNAETIYHFKLIIYYEIFYSEKIKDVLAFGTIVGKYLKVKYFATLFIKSNISSFLYLKKNGIAKNQVLEKLGVNKEITVGQYYGAMQLINSTGLFFDIEDFGFDDAFMHKVKKLMGQAVKDRKQTILIPNRIYSEFIKSGLDVFEKFNQHSAEIEKYFVNQVYSTLSPMELRSTAHFSRNAKKHGILEFNNAFEITNASSFIVRLIQIQIIGFLLIACFSGMRKSEIQSLGVDCLNTSKIGDREIYTLTAYTAKTSNQGIKRVTWITSELIKPVIDALKVLRIICKEYSDYKNLYTDLSLEDYPLLPNYVHKKLDEIKGSHPIFDYPPLIAEKIDVAINQLIKNIDFRQSDLDELTHFNPLIDWGEEYKLEIGKNWVFRSHQFRRSLVVYGVRSGYIQFPSLKKQLQHLTIDMTTYYGNQAGSAQNLFEEKIVTEFRKENIRYQFVQYEEKVLNNNDLLFGGEGTRIHLSKLTADGPYYLENKKTTYKHFEEGRMAYKKTYLGGCAKIGACDKLGFSYITVCLNCKDAIFDSSSKETMKKTKQAFLQRLQKYEPDSITNKQLQIEINAIDKVLNKVNVIEVEVSDV